jgi:hypothetical protein
VTIRHGSTPKVESSNDQAVAGTLAPIISREKPQLSPRLAAGLTKNTSGIGDFSAVHARHRGAQCNQKARAELRLCLFLLAFCWAPAPFASGRRCHRRQSAAPAHNGMMLLIFSAGLIRRFRIVSIVTILQHAIHPYLSDSGR